MKHLGDICKINGAEIEPVDCITGGSPCQDLSIAGKRAGLAGKRSGLFMEQVRIVKEMRERDKRNGRTGDMVRPRFLVWENVPGAFSSNGGGDFQAVLEEIIHIAEPTVSVPRFEGKWTKAGAIDGDGWSVAWRTHDAQYWGVPQRRRRISVVADFGGQSAGEILFERQGLHGDIAESGAPGEGPAEDAEAGASYAVRIRGGCDGGEKGALVQDDKSGTLGTGNDQTIFCLQGNGIDRADTAGCNGKGWREDTSYTLNTIDRPAVCAGFKPNNSEQARSIGYGEEQSPTLNAESKPAVLCLNDQGGNVMGVSHDVSGTMRAQEHGHQPTILDMSHACDVIRDCGEVAPGLQARMGTGGNQVPLTYQDVTGTLSPGAHAGSYNGQDAYNDMLVCGVTPDAARAILYQPKSAMEENWAASETKNALRAGESKVSHAVVCDDVSHTLRAKAGCEYREDEETYICSAVDCWNGKESDVAGTMQARTGHTLNANGVVRSNMVVRRLTPLECTRLQGYPDGWVDIGDWTDENGKKHKDADSPKYKALGNSIALPFWYWMFCRMAEHLPEKATLGSLFDGISGFNVCWARVHGSECCQWSSEIEQFPIAVTKKHFGDEEAGKEGDFEKFFGRNKKENV